MRKKLLNAVLLFGIVGALGSGAAFTSAYLINGDQTTNTFNATKVNVSIDEYFEKPADPQPGDVVTKEVNAVNTSDIPVYVIMRAEVSNSDLLEPLSIQSGWTKKSDGFYYYDRVLDPGEASGELFTSVTIKKSALKEELKDLDVLVYAEAVQAGDLSMDEAWATMD